MAAGQKDLRVEEPSPIPSLGRTADTGAVPPGTGAVTPRPFTAGVRPNSGRPRHVHAKPNPNLDNRCIAGSTQQHVGGSTRPSIVFGLPAPPTSQRFDERQPRPRAAGGANTGIRGSPTEPPHTSINTVAVRASPARMGSRAGGHARRPRQPESAHFNSPAGGNPWWPSRWRSGQGVRSLRVRSPETFEDPQQPSHWMVLGWATDGKGGRPPSSHCSAPALSRGSLRTLRDAVRYIELRVALRTI